MGKKGMFLGKNEFLKTANLCVFIGICFVLAVISPYGIARRIAHSAIDVHGKAYRAFGEIAAAQYKAKQG